MCNALMLRVSPLLFISLIRVEINIDIGDENGKARYNFAAKRSSELYGRVLIILFTKCPKLIRYN